MKKLSIALTVLMISAGVLTACSSGSDTLAQVDRETESQWGLTFYEKGEEGESETGEETESEEESSTEDVKENSAVITEVADGIKMLAMEDTEIQSVSPVNVRSGPGTDFEKIGGLLSEETVIMDGICDNEWAHIRFDDKEGYVSMGYLQSLEGNTSLEDLLEQAKKVIEGGQVQESSNSQETEESVEETQETEKETAPKETRSGKQNGENQAWATIDVSIRKGPGSNYDSIGVLKQDEGIKVLDSSDIWWWKVEYNGQEAYISAQYLTTDEPQP